MAVFRVEKTKDFTVMSNHHLRNVSLSLKAKGLLSLMLSLPDNWDYTTKGLAHICKDGVDSISSAIKELEKQGYLTRRRLRDYHGVDACGFALLKLRHREKVPPVLVGPGEVGDEIPQSGDAQLVQGLCLLLADAPDVPHVCVEIRHACRRPSSGFWQ